MSETKLNPVKIVGAQGKRREFIGTEISREYFEKEEKRFAEYTAQTRMF